MRRFIICTDEAFPRGSAGANYILYFAKALMDIGFTPIVISYAEDAKGMVGKVQKFEEISYILVEPPKEKMKHFLTFHFGLHQLYLPILDQLDISDQDIVWLYTAELPLIKGIRKYANQKQYTLGACVVEWYTAYASKTIKDKWSYQRYKKVYKKEFTKIHNLLPISHWLNNYYSRFNLHTMVLPIMTEVKPMKKQFTVSDTIRFIYPGGKSNKDDVKTVLTVLAEIGRGKKYEIHLTGIHEEIGEFLKQYPQYVYNEMQVHLKLHAWLSYHDLENLYDQMDFMILIRQRSDTTLANFPSKIPETMSHGVVPVVCNIGDYGKILADKLGDTFLFLHNTDEEYKIVLERIFAMDKTQINEQKALAYNVADQYFDYHNFESQLNNFLDNKK